MDKIPQLAKRRAAAQAATGSSIVPAPTSRVSNPTEKRAKSILSSADITCREGWTKAAIAKFLARPDVTERWHYAGHGSGLRYLYDEARVLKVESSAEFAQWKERRAARVVRAMLRAANASAIARAEEEVLAQARAQEIAKLAEMFPNWRDALPLACDYLFDLNRYAKHRVCGSYTRDKIYSAKNGLIEVLYLHGYSVECYEHSTELPAKTCFRCGGTGQDDTYDDVTNQTYSSGCMHCGGSGTFAPAKSLTFIVFKFKVNEKNYCWHQPDSLVRFHITATQGPAAFDLAHEEKPVSLPATKVDEALRLIQWVIKEATTTVQADRPVPDGFDAANFSHQR